MLKPNVFDKSLQIFHPAFLHPRRLSIAYWLFLSHFYFLNSCELFKYVVRFIVFIRLKTVSKIILRAIHLNNYVTFRRRTLLLFILFIHRKQTFMLRNEFRLALILLLNLVLLWSQIGAIRCALFIWFLLLNGYVTQRFQDKSFSYFGVRRLKDCTILKHYWTVIFI